MISENIIKSTESNPAMLQGHKWFESLCGVISPRYLVTQITCQWLNRLIRRYHVQYTLFELMIEKWVTVTNKKTNC